MDRIKGRCAEQPSEEIPEDMQDFMVSLGKKILKETLPNYKCEFARAHVLPLLSSGIQRNRANEGSSWREDLLDIFGGD
jgi:hypothetical protein